MIQFMKDLEALVRKGLDLPFENLSEMEDLLPGVPAQTVRVTMASMLRTLIEANIDFKDFKEVDSTPPSDV